MAALYCILEIRVTVNLKWIFTHTHIHTQAGEVGRKAAAIPDNVGSLTSGVHTKHDSYLMTHNKGEADLL